VCASMWVHWRKKREIPVHTTASSADIHNDALTNWQAESTEPQGPDRETRPLKCCGHLSRRLGQVAVLAGIEHPSDGLIANYQGLWAMEKHINPVLGDAFPFAGRRCDRVTENVLARLGLS
jgi:hypothetical protein